MATDRSNLISRRKLLAIASGLVAAAVAEGPVCAEPPVPKVGRRAPSIAAIHSDGNALGDEDLAGKVVLVVVWRPAADGSGLPRTQLSPLRRAYAKQPNFLILTVCVGAPESAEQWVKTVGALGQVDYGDGPRKFLNDPRWWNVFEVSRRPGALEAFGAGPLPAYFLIRADGTLGAVNVPEKKLRAVLNRELKIRP